MMGFRTMRERGKGKGASLSNEIILADSGGQVKQLPGSGEWEGRFFQHPAKGKESAWGM
jgi:hypothetical protein